MRTPKQGSDPCRGLRGLLRVCLIGSCAVGARASELAEDHTLSMEFVTPHTAWAKPYAGGRTRVRVFIVARAVTSRSGLLFACATARRDFAGP